MINRNAVVAAPVGGLLLGALDFVWIKYVPSPFGELGNSLAVWAVAGFLFAYWGRWGWARGIAAAVVMLVVAVPSYYLAAAVIQDDDVANMYNSVAIMWMGAAVIAGVVFGGAGIAARRPGRWQLAASAMPTAVMFAEAVVYARRIGDRNYGSGPLWTALIDVTLGILLTVLVVDTWRRRLVALLAAVPLTAVGLVLLTGAGFR
ncbi:DUF6518 family protein [Actinoplanes auranticolor]|uniref:Uncharacterized protein n=1 Tax=Actinoplanes auranticolor TaxID=47988 RepID=A0A919S656_9ACTN|nr:DUF6518 family protein [Actinoplanes auranticolor]GIM64553.1 hypothetical protein Aau02nite_11130 [Actinoplanes auranticolor]